jgi:ABC-type transport system involved in cytochrome bd biosynthesis fused ATPase/permease subunit
VSRSPAPFALDSENGLAVMGILADIAKDPSRGVLVVTHDPRTMRFADRIVHIEDGSIVGEEKGGAGREHDPSPAPCAPPVRKALAQR